jgi:ribosomal protein S20
LPALLRKIAAKSKPLTLPEFVFLSRQAGYASEARDYPNMVYQALLKLVRKGVLIKDTASRVYRFNGESAES